MILNKLKNEYFWLILILVFGFVVRLYKIDNPIADWHSWRQADTASVSRTYFERGINILYPKYQDISSIQTGFFNPNGYRMVEVPIYNVIHVQLFTLFKTFTLEVWGRLLTIFSSLVSALFIFLLGKRYLGKLGGILASFFFLFLPYNIYYSRVILPDPLAATFALASLWFFVRFIDCDKKSQLWISGTLLSLAVLVKPFVIFYSVPMLYLLVRKYSISKILKDARLLIPLLIFVDIISVPLLLWRAWINQFPSGIPFFIWMFNGDGIRFRPAFFRWIFGERIGQLILGGWGLVPFSIGILRTEKKNSFNLAFLGGLTLYLIIVATANVKHDYYQIFLIPPIALILGQGALSLWQDKKIFTLGISRSILVFSIVIMLGLGTYQVKEYYKINHPEIMEAGKAIDSIAPKNALVVAPYNGDTAFLYQTGRWGWPAIDSSIDQIIKRGASYYVSVSLNDKDTQDVIKRFTVVEKTDSYVIVNLLKSKAK